MAKYISSFDLAHYCDWSHDNILELLYENDLASEDDVLVKITESEYRLICIAFEDDVNTKIERYFGVQENIKFHFDLFGGETEIRPKKQKQQAIIPSRTWEEPDYLPNLEDSQSYQYNLWASFNQPFDEELVFDIEIYGNYFLIFFVGYRTGKCYYFEKYDDYELDIPLLTWFVNNHTLISFNGIKFDSVILAMALHGKSFSELWRATEMLILEESRPYQVLKHFKVKQLDLDHIDLIEVSKGKASLKQYAARLNCPNIQDLPFKAGIDLNYDQMTIVRRYCLNDCEATAYLYNFLYPQIQLRDSVGKQNKLDIRSKSDAQMAEAIIKKEVEGFLGREIYKGKVDENAIITYSAPKFIEFKTPELQKVLQDLKTERFEFVGGKMRSELLKNTIITIDGVGYQLGSGGLHSTEKSISHFSDDDFELIDADVTSYYPSIIMLLQLYPEQLGNIFLKVYKGALDKRVHAKKVKDKIIDACYKILLNGSFGKFGSEYSILFAPKLLVAVTVTGQLSLLMLIERLHLAGVQCVSANTDGVVIRSPRNSELVTDIISQWMHDTGFNMEYTHYQSIHSRDVNNYFAIKTNGEIKRKGAYSYYTKPSELEIDKNTSNMICSEAVAEFLKNGTSIEDTVRGCTRMNAFLTLCKVDGGAVKDTEYLGKVVRFYHSTATNTALIYAKTGHTVPMSEKCRPMMRLTKEIPIDLDYDWYITKCYEILKDVGFK